MATMIRVATSARWSAAAAGPSREVRKTLVVHVVDAACRLVPEPLPHPNLRALFPADADGH